MTRKTTAVPEEEAPIEKKPASKKAPTQRAKGKKSATGEESALKKKAAPKRGTTKKATEKAASPARVQPQRPLLQRDRLLLHPRRRRVPSKAKTIGKYLGKGFKVIASKGHVKDLPRASWASTSSMGSNRITRFSRRRNPPSMNSRTTPSGFPTSTWPQTPIVKGKRSPTTSTRSWPRSTTPSRGCGSGRSPREG